MSSLPIVERANIEAAYFLRLTVADQPGVLRAITSILAERDISVEAILQKEPKQGEDASVALISSVTREGLIDAAIQDMQALAQVRAPITRLRVESLD